MRHRSSGRETGSAIALLLVMVVICGGVSAAALVSNSASHREAGTEFEAERAFQLAESGADWAVTQVRIRNGVVPAADVTTTVPGAGSFTIHYTQGNANAVDDDGDGDVDDAEEAIFAVVRSTGTSGRISRTVQTVIRTAVTTPVFAAPLQLNVTSPIIDFSGNAFTIDGRDHLPDGTLDPSKPATYGIASPATVATLAAQVPAKSASNITGIGLSPSLGTSTPIDLTGLVQSVQAAATVIVSTGAKNNLTLGSTAPGDTVVAYCPGDLQLTGGASGAGILAVDGDLDISGGFTWTGIIIVRGQVTLTGGGKKIVGALAVGADVTATTSTQSVDIKGSVEIDYSSQAVATASAGVSAMTLQAWREVANP